MVHNLNKQPPQWAPDAVATEHGWKHPVTGELLVAIKLDPEAFSTVEQPVTPAEETKVDPVETPAEPVAPSEAVAVEKKPAPVAKPKPGPKPKATTAK